MGPKHLPGRLWCWYCPLLLLWLMQRPVATSAAKLLLLLLTASLLLSLLSQLSRELIRAPEPRPDFGQCQVFMVETERASSLSTVQACAIESVAHHHPSHTVCLAVLTDNANFSWTSLRRRLRSVDNLRVLPLSLEGVADLLEWSPAREVGKHCSWLYSCSYSS